jgi:hypothetical protein
LIEMAKHAHHKREAAIIVPTAAISWLSATERTAAGKVLRDKVPRVDQDAWLAPSGRSDPIRILHKADAGRLPELVLLRYGRMLVSPFTFYRGSADIMAADLSGTPATGIRVQCCGDAQLMNFGGFATPERHLVLAVNDLDETLPAPWEWGRQATGRLLRARRPLQRIVRRCWARRCRRRRPQLPRAHARLRRHGRAGHLVLACGNWLLQSSDSVA